MALKIFKDYLLDDSDFELHFHDFSLLICDYPSQKNGCSLAVLARNHAKNKKKFKPLFLDTGKIFWRI